MLRLNKYFLSCKGKVYNIFKAMFSCEKRNRVNENRIKIKLNISWIIWLRGDKLSRNNILKLFGLDEMKIKNLKNL